MGRRIPHAEGYGYNRGLERRTHQTGGYEHDGAGAHASFGRDEWIEKYQNGF